MYRNGISVIKLVEYLPSLRFYLLLESPYRRRTEKSAVNDGRHVAWMVNTFISIGLIEKKKERPTTLKKNQIKRARL